MIFLLEYDPTSGKLILFKRFEDSQRKQAQDERLELELDLLRKGINHEVNILEAKNEELVRDSHARYFYKERK